MTTTLRANDFFEHLTSVKEQISIGDKQFYMSLLWQYENKTPNKLSSAQMYHLERLYNKYSIEELQKQRDFAENYSKDQRLMAIRCAEYYSNQYPPYYETIITKVLEDPQGHTLQYNQFNKMCNNKYAKKVLSCYDADPLYKVGDFVQIRATNRIDIANTNQKEGHQPRRNVCGQLANKVCMVLETNAKPITRAAKGARIYKVLITNEARPIYAHESDLKKQRRQKNEKRN